MRRLKSEDLIYLSPADFNDYRKKLSSAGNSLPTLSGKYDVTRDLRRYDLDGARFYGCKFSNVSFGDIADISFNNCKFENCRFIRIDDPRTPGFSSGKLTNIVFFECTFNNTIFDGNDLCRVKFYDPKMLTVPSFLGSRIDDYLIYEQGILSVEFCNAFSSAISLIDCRIVLVGQISRPFLSWESLRNIGRLPFLQISLISLVFLSAISILAAELNNKSLVISKWCMDIIIKMEINELSHAIDFCKKFENIVSNGIVWSIIFPFFLNFFAIFVAALILTTKCPPEVIEFSKTTWEKSLRKPSEIYEALAHKNAFWCYIAFVLYVFSIIYFLWRTTRAFYSFI